MKIVNRYIVEEFFSALLFGVFVFTFILLLDRLFTLINLFLTKKVGIILILRLFSTLLPTILSLSLPMALLFALVFTYGRLSEDNEITALRASGIRVVKLSLPVLIVSLLFSFGLLPFNSQVVPDSQHQFKKIYAQIIYQNPVVRLEEKSFWTVGNYRLWIEKISKNRELKNISLYRFEGEGQPLLRIVARRGRYTLSERINFVLYLEDGSIQRYDIHDPSHLVLSNFMNYTITIPLGTSTQGIISKGLRELRSDEISNEIRKYRLRGIPTAYLEVEYYLRIVLAFSCFCLALVGIPVGIKLERGGRATGFGVSLLITFFYYLLMVSCIVIGEKGVLPASISLWVPNFLLFGIGSILFYRLSKY